MESHEVLKTTIKEVGVKSVAADMNLSTSLLYKWCEPKTSDAGADNPLDRLLKIFNATQCTNPTRWLCERVGGFLVMNSSTETSDTPVLQATHAIVRDFSDMLEAVSESYKDDGSIDEAEAQRIRREWETLKSVCETFVVACERGEYQTNKPVDDYTSQ